MKIAYVHHHLRPGGVTRVMKEQMACLEGEHEVVGIVGEPPACPVGFPLIIVPEIAYDRDRKIQASPEKTCEIILGKVRSIWKQGADVYHFHNPTLGKNKDFLKIIKLLKHKGAEVLLQIHDFAEDGRPWNYTPEPYPADCHYAVINKRDYLILLKAGLNKRGLHLLPNPVRGMDASPPPGLPGATEDFWRNLVLYPVRAIRRKNIGEAVLLSLFLPNNDHIGVTLEPTGSVDRKSYRDWVSFSKENRLRIRFGLGVTGGFEKLLAEARCFITTSIKEGFGFCYLEPWTIDRMVFGRLLPGICSDFSEKGMSFDHLYSEIAVPLSFFDLNLFRSTWVRCYLEKMSRYGIRLSPDEAAGHFDELVERGSVDFGCLNETLQKQVTLNVMDDKSKLSKMKELNPKAENLGSIDFAYTWLTAENKRIVQQEYSIPKYTRLLMEVYEKVLNTRVSQAMDKKIILDQFTVPEKNQLLLCESAYE
ncbi:MAG: hypothetical protein ACOC7U_03920 [Spirochaetota bacterium]